MAKVIPIIVFTVHTLIISATPSFKDGSHLCSHSLVPLLVFSLSSFLPQKVMALLQSMQSNEKASSYGSSALVLGAC